MDIPALNPNDRLPSIIPTEFFVDYVHDKNGEVREIECVKWQKIGNNGSETIERIAHLKRDGGPKWEVLGKYYEAWKTNSAPPVNGTPLERWPDATPRLIKMLNDLSIRTLEDFVGINDTTMEKIQTPGIRALLDKARKFLASQEVVSAVQVENDKLKAMLADLQDQINAMQAPKPKRGRPPKVANEPAHAGQ